MHWFQTDGLPKHDCLKTLNYPLMYTTLTFQNSDKQQKLLHDRPKYLSCIHLVQ